MPDSIGKARLENGATVLMERLIKRIEENAEKQNSVGNKMLPTDVEETSVHKKFNYGDITFRSNNTEHQKQAIIAALSNDITYMGTARHWENDGYRTDYRRAFKHKRSVLVVSHTNIAVDGAIEQADKTYFGTHGMVDKNYLFSVLLSPSHCQIECY